MSVPEMDDVREYLGGLSEDRLANNVIIINISTSKYDVDYAKSSTAPDALVSKAYLVAAAYYCYRAYVAKLERTIGRIPSVAYLNLKMYKEDFDRFLRYVKGGAAPPGLLGLVTLREHQIDVAGSKPNALEVE